MSVNSKTEAEFGDFQTPFDLCQRVCKLLKERVATPQSIVEPTCGAGSFLLASRQAFPECGQVLGFELNSQHVSAAKGVEGALVEGADFFETDWSLKFNVLPEPILVIGNPPWVTNSAMGLIGGTNVPAKSNVHKFSGLDALTGKSNFDISEWMLSHLLEQLSGRSAVLAMLCKVFVARKVLQHAWKNDLDIESSSMYLIDAAKHFGASVQACLLVCVLEPQGSNRECSVHPSLEERKRDSVLSLSKGRLVARKEDFEKYGHLYGHSPLKWRSGVKHDCTRVMELKPIGNDVYANRLGERIELESTYLFPMLKSSELVKEGSNPSRYMLVPQKSMKEDTSAIRHRAPRTWEYLESHAMFFERRASSIYRNRPRFSVFGIGDYSFALWKVAISGFYKQLLFRVIGPFEGKPVVFDDTCYFLPCHSKQDASSLLEMLHSPIATTFLNSMIFWDAKRPITAGLLDSLNLEALADELGDPLPVGFTDPE